MCLRSLFVLFWIFEIHPQGRSFMKILPYCNLYKMVIFATFQNDVVFFNIKCVFSRVSPKISLMCVKSQFLYDFDSLCKMGNFATLPNCVLLLLLNVFVSSFPTKHLYSFSRVFKILLFLEYLIFIGFSIALRI